MPSRPARKASKSKINKFQISKSKVNKPLARKSEEIHLYVGTAKGGFLFRSDRKRRSWKLEGPFFPGWEVTTLTRDGRSGKVWAALFSAWFGTDLQVSGNHGRTWRKSADGLGFTPDRNMNLTRIWRITPDRESHPKTIWCGVDPGALFRSDDGGKSWHEVTGLTQHATRAQWAPGAGGLTVHAILPDPWNRQRIYAGISAAGCFRSDDDGTTWRPMNKGVLADFLPDKFPEVGQCVHSMALSPLREGLLFQQNHCGVYRSRNGAEQWEDIGRGLPSRFGFPITMHPHEPETVFVVPEDSAEKRYVYDAKLTVYRSRNGGGNWQKLTRGLPRKDVYTQVLRHAMTADACDDAGIYMGTTSGEIFYSRDGGDSWELLHSHLPRILSLHAVAV